MKYPCTCKPGPYGPSILVSDPKCPLHSGTIEDYKRKAQVNKALIQIEAGDYDLVPDDIDEATDVPATTPNNPSQ